MSYDSEVLADTPQIYWKLQDTSGTTAADSSAIGTRTGTYNGTATTNYALNQSVNLVSSAPAEKSVKMMRDSAVESGHPTLRANLTDASTTNGKASISRSYETWMNASGVAFSAECWYKIPATLNRYAGIFTMMLGTRRSTSPVQWALQLGGFYCLPSMNRWEASVSAAAGQPAYGSTSYAQAEASLEAAVGGNFEQTSEDPGVVLPTGYFKDGLDGLAHHVVGACGANSVKVYMDGLLGVNYWESGVPAIPTETTMPVIFGGLNTTGNMLGLLGWMSHCAHYPSELSAARVAAHFTAGGTKVTFLNQQWALLAASELLMAEAATLNGAMGQVHRGNMVLTEAATFTLDMLALVRQVVALAESVTLTATVGYQQKLSVAFLDAVSITQQITVSRFVQMLLTGLATLQDGLAVGQKSTMSLSDIVTAAIIIKAGDQELVGWVINPALAASASLENYGFTGFGEHKGVYYGLRADGLYSLGGATDNGSAINSFISLGNRNFGSAKLKNVPYAYIGAATNGTMVLKVIADGQTHLYSVRNPSTDMAEQRVDMGRGLRANYWNFELMNQNGEDFDIHSIKFMPVVLERRI